MATNDKYDRQLRLWGANGQRALMSSHILLINADAVGSETLKNLVLPGIGHFTILDSKVVSEEYMGNNFFVDKAGLGRPRAEVVRDLLCEMNPDVQGFAINEEVSTVFDKDAEFLDRFGLVVAANLPERELLAVASMSSSKRVPLLAVRSYGLLGYCRLQLENHNIIESKPDSDPFDLRILNPFKELDEYCSGFNLSEMESLEHGHTPYIIILYQAMQRWRSEHAGVLPKTFAEKESFKQSIKSMSRDFNMEMNFQEAVKEYYRAFATKDLPGEVIEIIDNQCTKVLDAQSTEFE
jgi:amyloid beta precursor protein binding protein 1